MSGILLMVGEGGVDGLGFFFFFLVLMVDNGLVDVVVSGMYGAAVLGLW